MRNLKIKLHELIDKTSDNIVLENIYNALQQHVDLQKRDILDDLSFDQLNQLNESIGEYRKGNTKTHEEVLQLLKQWKSK